VTDARGIQNIPHAEPVEARMAPIQADYFSIVFDNAEMAAWSRRISASFFARLHPFSRLSHAIASVSQTNCSDQTSSTGLRDYV
jgi:hypothetical protein